MCLKLSNRKVVLKQNDGGFSIQQQDGAFRIIYKLGLRSKLRALQPDFTLDSQNERSQMGATAKCTRAQQINNMSNRFLDIWGLWLICSVVQHLNFAGHL